MHKSKVWNENNKYDSELDKVKKHRSFISNAEYYLITNTDDIWCIDLMIIQELGVESGKPIMAMVG